MIIKSLSRSSGSTGQLLTYIFRYILEKDQKEEQEKTGKSPGFSKHDVPEFMHAFEEGKLDFSALPYTEISAYRDLIERELDTAVRIAKTTALGKELAQRERAHGADLKRTQLYLTPNYLIARSKGIDKLFKLSPHTRASSVKQPAKEKQEPFIIRHNLRSRSVSGYIREFEKVESLRQHVRTNSPVVYHTILSFGAEDKEHITDEILRDLAHKFIELRGPDNLYVGTKHTDRDHVHLHLAMSAVDLAGRSVRISKAKFQELKTELQKYQHERYPELNHSLPDHGKKQRIKNREAEVKNIKPGRTTEKFSLLKVLEATFAKATSSDHFISLLQEQGYSPYHRSGTLTGVSASNNLKFRFSKLGYSQEKINSLNQAKEYGEKEMAELRLLRESKAHDRTQERLATLNEARPVSPTKSNELEELQSIRDGNDGNKGKEDDRAIQIEKTDRETDSRDREDTERSDSNDEDDRSR